MKRIVYLLMCLSLCFSFYSCANVEERNIKELNEIDYMYIDTVFNTMPQWDVSRYDSGMDHYIDKISFQDFDGTDKISFYVNYPIAGYCGLGYYIYDDNLEFISFDIYDQDNIIRNRGCIIQTVTNGTDWNHTATNEEKYEMIKSAYVKFMKTNK